MSDYRLVPSKVFLKDAGRLPADMRPRVETALLCLKTNPRSGKDIRKLVSVEIGVWRLRIGDWRLRYDIVDDEIRLHVIRHRKDVYRNG